MHLDRPNKELLMAMIDWTRVLVLLNKQLDLFMFLLSLMIVLLCVVI